MNESADRSQPAAGRYAKRAWQSDVIVDLIKHYGFPYIALNPGASYRGLHDSLVNYGGNDPPLLLCQHEKIAVQIAHGYAKRATSRCRNPRTAKRRRRWRRIRRRSPPSPSVSWPRTIRC
jgi:hypothetical protein